MAVVISKKIEDTGEVARRVLDYAKKRRDMSGATVVGLYGDLGAGKTAFVKEVTKITGIKENAPSPTFVILKKYKTSDKKFKKLIHIDAYRLGDEKELKQLNWSEIIKNPENIIFVEWAERIKKSLPKDMIKIYFEFVDENTRKIEW